MKHGWAVFCRGEMEFFDSSAASETGEDRLFSKEDIYFYHEYTCIIYPAIKIRGRVRIARDSKNSVRM